MRKSPWLLSILLALTVLLTACGSPQATPVASLPTAVPPTSAPATEAPSAVPVTGPGATVAMASSATFGPILVDDKGMTLYMFEKDTPNTSSCYGQCEKNWPPLLTTGAPVAGEGIDASKLGTTQRTDGTLQVTYNGWPVYYYIKDKAAGDLAGQGVGDVWFVLAPDGSVLKEAPQPSSSAGTTVAMTASASFGPILVDDKGMTLYMFQKDTPNTSSCYGGCAANWPPLLTTGAPAAAEGIQASLLGTTQRTDGTLQVTYNGWPLYYYNKDAQAGDMVGQGVGDVWFVLAPDGSVLQQAPQSAAPPPAPTSAYSAPY